jgi:hypothetical protein
MRLSATVLVCVLFVSVFSIAGARATLAASPGLELKALLVDPAPPLTDASDEFVELHNAGATPVTLSNYKLRIGASTTLHALPSDTLQPDATIRLTSKTSPWALGNTGGQVALLDAAGSVIDSTTWPAALPGATWAKNAGGTWTWDTAGTPSTGPGGAYPELELNELLPDPAAPLTDAKDEYVELFNPNSQPVNVSGYVVKTGANLSAKHTLTGALIAAGGYMALKSADTKIALANAGSSIALFDPAGKQLGTTITFGKATTGAAWARIGDTWAWTSKPTPGAANVLADLPAATVAGKSTKSISTAKTAKAAKVKTPASSSKSKAKAVATKQAPAANAVATAPSGSWLLFVLAGLTLAYVIYEFRYDLLNFYKRLRRHSRSSGAPVEATQGR